MSYPVKCPICEGHGNVPGGFYTSVPGSTMISNCSQEQCRTCFGSGIVWCKEDNKNELRG